MKIKFSDLIVASTCQLLFADMAAAAEGPKSCELPEFNIRLETRVERMQGDIVGYQLTLENLGKTEFLLTHLERAAEVAAALIYERGVSGSSGGTTVQRDFKYSIHGSPETRPRFRTSQLKPGQRIYFHVGLGEALKPGLKLNGNSIYDFVILPSLYLGTLDGQNDPTSLRFTRGLAKLGSSGCLNHVSLPGNSRQ